MRGYLLRFGVPWLILCLIALTPHLFFDYRVILDSIPQFDKFQHFTAGCACGVFGSMLYPLCGGKRHFAPDLARNMTILLAVLTGLAVGGIWEAAEATIPEMNSMPLEFWDTLIDLIMDAGGALVSGVVYARMKPLD